LPGASVETLPYGSRITLNGVGVSLHPAGHILGSAQVRIEHKGEVWVVSGDYKVEADSTCAAFEPVRCHTFVTESTFGLPIYRWAPQTEVFGQINNWWRTNRDRGRASVLYGYALGKAQRLISGLDASIGPIYTHGAVEKLATIYRARGIALPDAPHTDGTTKDWSGAMIIAPPSAHGSPWLRKFGEISTAFASGWMRIRGTRRRRSVDRGFVLSDHADWPGLLSAVEATGAACVWVTHGYRGPMVRWLTENGIEARAVESQFEGEESEEPAT
jgi:putative mRNA 3-end processing factor